MRCKGTKFFSDGHDGDAAQSLINATQELIARITSSPIDLPLRTQASPRKTSDLPPGISGPIVRPRQDRALTAELSVSIPRFDRKSEIKTIYIGTEKTYTADKYLEAVDKAIKLREQAVARYRRDANKARKETVLELQAHVLSLRGKVAKNRRQPAAK